MKKLSHYLLICLFLTPLPILAQEDEPLRVLFVGNSYTYFWNMPMLVSLMAKSLGKDIYTKQATVGGTNLEQHWKGEENTNTRQLIELGSWDYIVFNNHSLSPRDIPDSFQEFSQKFAALAKENGAHPVFYMTWARKFNRLMQPTISAAYRTLAKKSGADVVPVGEVWMESISYHPEKNLYAIDNSHPSPLGAYLTALLFTKYFTGQSVTEIPSQLYFIDDKGDKLYISMMLDDNADFFRELVELWDIENTKNH